MISKAILNHVIGPVDILSARHVLAVAAHADDIEISLGALIAKLVERGTVVTYVVITDELGLGRELPEGQQSIRREEQLEAARSLGVSDIRFLGYPDAGIYDQQELRVELIGLLHELGPDVLLAPDPTLRYESHPDHIKAGQAALQAAMLSEFFEPGGRMASIKRAGMVSEYTLKAVGLYFTDNPNRFYPLGRYLQKKRTAIAAHHSQFSKESLHSLLLYDTLHHRYSRLRNCFRYTEELRLFSVPMLHCMPESSR